MRIFERVELDEKEKGYGYMYCKRSSDGWEILVGTVMYGYRVYVRTEGDRYGFSADFCGGRPALQVKLLYCLIEKQLSKDRPVRELLGEIPQMKRRPYYNDPDWIMEMVKLTEGQDHCDNNITQSGLEEGRRRAFAKFEEFGK